MTVRGVRSRSCGVDGWLTLSAGRRAGDADEAACTEPEPVTGDTVPNWDRYVAAAREESYGAVPGTLGQRLTDAGACIETVGPGAAVAGADEQGRVEHQLDAVTAGPACEVELVDAGTLPGGRPGAHARPWPTSTRSWSRSSARRAPGTRIVVAGVGRRRVGGRAAGGHRLPALRPACSPRRRRARRDWSSSRTSRPPCSSTTARVTPG